METLLGKTLLTKSGKEGATAALLKDKELVALYFSASWCPPCKAFTPVLVDFYKQWATEEKVEIIYVSSDRNIADFQAYYGKMPWLALSSSDPTVKSALASQLRIQGIPSLIVLDVKTGLFVTADARSQIQGAAGNTTANRQVISGWKATAPVPIAEGLGRGSEATSMFKQIMMGIFKNPMYIFGVIYLVKWILRKLAKQGGVDQAPLIEEYHKPIPDDEF